MPEDARRTERRGETSRVEAFSDGVFAVAITLLVLVIHAPDTPLSDRDLAKWLLQQWPVFSAFVTSFVTVGVMWINHHRMFEHIQRIDLPLLSLNLLLLLLVVFVPVPTLLLAENILLPGQHLAGLAYSGTYILLAICFNLLWGYATHRRRLMGDNADLRAIREITAQYRFGPFFYIATFLLAWVSQPASLAANLLIAVFFALPGRSLRLGREADLPDDQGGG